MDKITKEQTSETSRAKCPSDFGCSWIPNRLKAADSLHAFPPEAAAMGHIPSVLSLLQQQRKRGGGVGGRGVGGVRRRQVEGARPRGRQRTHVVEEAGVIFPSAPTSGSFTITFSSPIKKISNI